MKTEAKYLTKNSTIFHNDRKYVISDISIGNDQCVIVMNNGPIKYTINVNLDYPIELLKFADEKFNVTCTFHELAWTYSDKSTKLFNKDLEDVDENNIIDIFNKLVEESKEAYKKLKICYTKQLTKYDCNAQGNTFNYEIYNDRSMDYHTIRLEITCHPLLVIKLHSHVKELQEKADIQQKLEEKELKIKNDISFLEQNGYRVTLI
jgi:hypothetical protein